MPWKVRHCLQCGNEDQDRLDVDLASIVPQPPLTIGTWPGSVAKPIREGTAEIKCDACGHQGIGEVHWVDDEPA